MRCSLGIKITITFSLINREPFLKDIIKILSVFNQLKLFYFAILSRMN